MDLQDIPFTRTRRVVHDVIARALQAVEYELEVERAARVSSSLRAAGSESLRGSVVSLADGRERVRSRGDARAGETKASDSGSLPRVPTSPVKLRRATSTKVLLAKMGSLGQDALVASLGEEVGVTEELAPGRVVRSPLTGGRASPRAKDGWSPESDSALRAIAEDRAGAPLPADSLPRVAFVAPKSQPELGDHALRALWEGFAPSRTTQTRQAILDPRNALGRPGPRGTVIWPEAELEAASSMVMAGSMASSALGADHGGAPTNASRKSKARRSPPTASSSSRRSVPRSIPRGSVASASPASSSSSSLTDSRTRLIGHHRHKTDRQVARLLRTIHAQAHILHERVSLG
jgi:hypothetical protein